MGNESVDVDYALQQRGLEEEVKTFSETGRDTAPGNRKSLGQKYCKYSIEILFAVNWYRNNDAIQ